MLAPAEPKKPLSKINTLRSGYFSSAVAAKERPVIPPPTIIKS
jgi:hypothetical protein